MYLLIITVPGGLVDIFGQPGGHQLRNSLKATDVEGNIPLLFCLLLTAHHFNTHNSAHCSNAPLFS